MVRRPMGPSPVCLGLTCALLALASCARVDRDAPPAPAAVPAPAPAAPAPATDAAAPAITAVAEGFDLAAYRADPAAYCRASDADRASLVAQPAAGVEALQSVGAGSLQVKPGGSVTLQARTAPGMPVSFTSQGLGEFPASGLATVTVPADAAGLAQAEFRASPGTVGTCLIIAGSPVRAGTVSFLVRIQE